MSEIKKYHQQPTVFFVCSRHSIDQYLADDMPATILRVSADDLYSIEFF